MILTPPIEVYPPTSPHKILVNFQIKSPPIIIGGWGGGGEKPFTYDLTKFDDVM